MLRAAAALVAPALAVAGGGQAGLGSSRVNSLFDAFEAPLVPGLASRDGLIDEAEEAELIRRIDAEPLAPFRFQQWTGKRLTRSFGWTYDFERGRMNEAEPLPAWLAPIRARAASTAGLQADELVQALLIRYDPGAGIGWHKDRPVFDHVVGVSLGHPAIFRLRRRIGEGFERAKVELAPRSVYHLSGEARHEWEHSIAPIDMPRWSITFRSLAAGRAAGRRHNAQRVDIG